jgi:aspartate aminotransferase-like enzyme
MLLFTPGPTPVPERIRQVMATPTIHHRTPEFTKIFKETRGLLKDFLNMEESVIFASSGTGAMEASMLNFCKKKALIVNSGKFGERFTQIAKSYNIDYVELKYNWDEAVKLDDIKEALEKNPDIDSFFIQICESSGGLRHPVEEAAELIKGLYDGIMVVADGITAIGVEPIDTSHIDVLIGGSQKALMLPPGLSFLGLSYFALRNLGDGRGYYFNVAKELKKQKEGTTAYTAATTLIIGLKEVLTILLKEIGLDELYDRTDRLATATRLALEGIGLSLYPQKPANAMTAIYDEDAEAIRKILKSKYGVNIAGGQDHLKGKLFRINHMGLVEPYEASWVVDAIELALEELRRVDYQGEANRIFNTTYFKILEE